MTKQEIKKALRATEKSVNKMRIAESEISDLNKFIQPFFEEEVTVCWGTDGAAITNDKGEIGFVENFLKEKLEGLSS